MTDDVSWVRDQLGPANPVPAPNEVTPPGPGLVAALAASETHEQAPVHRRRTVVAAVVGAAAVLAAAVAGVLVSRGGSGATRVTGSGAQVVGAAAGVTEAARSADVSLTFSVGPTSFTAQGAVDLSTGAADFTADLPAPIGSVEVRSTAGAVYLRLPSNFKGFTPSKPWVKVDRSTFQNVTGSQFGIPGLSGKYDFTGFLDWLRGVSGTVTTVSTNEVVHGDITTHYRATIDLAKAAANAPAAVRSKLEQAAQNEAAAFGGVPVDVWIDAQGRLRRLVVSYDRGSGPAVQATLELSGFGTPVNVVAPPADQVSDLGGLLPGLKRTLVVPGAKSATG